MRLLSDSLTKVSNSGLGDTVVFRIATNAKTFRGMIDTMYPNKVKAPIRELSTNAYEAHQLLKKENVPFEVKLPSAFDTNFIIRDFGPGISPEDINNIYTVLGESTKDDSNEFGGAFGLGSKSPFAYTDNFTVTSYYNGIATTYVMFKNEQGIPASSILNQEPSNEPTGIKITIDVKSGDVTKFVQEAQNVYKYFKTKPNVTGNNGYVHRYLTSGTSTVKGTGWEFFPNSNENETVAIMGNVGYSLSGYTGKYKELANKRGLIVHFDIGEVEPMINREGLSFEERTLKAIERRFETIVSEYSKVIQDRLNNEPNYWDAYCLYDELKNKAILPLYVTYKGRKFTEIELYKMVDIPGATQKQKEWIVKIYRITNRKSAYKELEDWITPKRTSKFIVDDGASYAKNRCQTYSKQHYNAFTYVISQDEKVAIQKLLDVDDSYFILLSSLPKPIFAKSNTTSIKTKVMKFRDSESVYNNSYWTDIEIDNTTTGYYVSVNNNKIEVGGKSYKPHDFNKLLHRVFGDTLPDIYGIKASYNDKKNPHILESLEVKIKGQIQSIVNQIQIELGYKETYNALYRINIGVMHLIDDIHDVELANHLLDLPNRIRLVVEKKSQVVNQTELMKVLTDLGHNVTIVPKADGKLIQDFTDMIKRYPLINNMEEMTSDIQKEFLFYIEGKLKKGN